MGILHIVRNWLHARGKPWTPEEDDAIGRLRSRFGGNRWSKIAREFGNGRTDNDVKNRWASLERSRGRRNAAAATTTMGRDGGRGWAGGRGQSVTERM